MSIVTSEQIMSKKKPRAPSKVKQPVESKNQVNNLVDLEKIIDKKIEPKIEATLAEINKIDHLEQPIHSNVKEAIPATKNSKKICPTCNRSLQRKKRAQTDKAPTAAQLVVRENFKTKVAEAKLLQSKEVGLSYRDAIKKVYAAH